MTYSPAAFDQFCLEATQQFLHTVVVIDNEAVFQLDDQEKEDQEQDVPDLPDPTGGTLTQSIASGENKVQASEQLVGKEEKGEGGEKSQESSNILYAKPLIDKFADDGIVCSVMRPDPNEQQVVKRAIKVASAADILVVDWMLGKTEGSEEPEDLRAREIIRGVIEKDLQKRGRLRLIAVYTAEDNPQDICEAVYNHIQSLQFPDGKISKKLQNSFLKIAVILKPQVSSHVPGYDPIEPGALPEKLQKLFSSLNHGLLPSITLRSIAAIREETHHLLAVLNKDLDPALVGHRCLLPDSKDSEEFCENLVAGEIRSVLAMANIGSKYGGEEANEKWIESQAVKDDLLKYEESHIDIDSCLSLVKKGPKEHKTFLNKLRLNWLSLLLDKNEDLTDKSGKAIDKEEIRKQVKNRSVKVLNKFNVPSLGATYIPQILSGSDKKGEKVNHIFSRLCSFKREAVGLRKPTDTWMPCLTLGTLLQGKENGEDIFLICLQPRCESVRLDKGEKRTYPFLLINKGKKKDLKNLICFNAIDSNNNVIEKSLYYEAKPKNQAVCEFESIEGEVILSQTKNDLYIFTDTQKNEFIWLGDLKDDFAQNIVNTMSSAVGSVGFNPYEWQRRK